MKPFVLCVLSVLSVLSLQASILPDAWGVDVNAHTAVQRTYKQGETIDLRISLRDGLKPLDLTGATARFYWFTNAVQNVWWTNSAAISTPKAGLVQATWRPAMDIGAASYAYWVGIWMPGSTSPLWRVTGTIRMLTSPGFTPNALLPPVRTLDFNAITVTNAPWVTASAWDSGSNALASAFQSHTDRTDNPHAVTAQQLGALTVESDALALAALATNRVNQIYGTNQWIDGDGAVWRITYAVSTNVVCTFSSLFGLLIAPDYYSAPENAPYTSTPGHQIVDNVWIIRFNLDGDGLWQIVNTEFGESWEGYGSALPVTTTTTTSFNRTCYGTATFDYAFTPYGPPITQRVDTVALRSDLTSSPSFPTNYIAGFILPIPGTNVTYTLSVDSNRTLSVWEVLP